MTAQSSAAAPPDPAKDAARLLHEALELTCWHFHACYPPVDTATERILADNRSLLALTRAIAGRDGTP